MSHLVHLFRQELRTYRLLLLGAGVLAVIPFLVAALSQERLAEVGVPTALLLLLLATLLVATAHAESAFARPLHEGRFGFQLTRPVSIRTLWLAKLLGAGALMATIAAVMVAPIALASGALSGLTADRIGAAVTVAALYVLLFYAAWSFTHAGSIAVRSGLRRIGLDFVAVVAFTGLILHAAFRLYRAGAESLAGAQLATAIALMTAALLFAGLRGLQVGRTALATCHRTLSNWMLPSLLLIGAAAQGHSSWVLAAGPDDVDFLHVTPAPAGTFVHVLATVQYRPGFVASFAYDTASGQLVRTGNVRSRGWGQEVKFSGDGRVLAWVQDPVGIWHSGRVDFTVHAIRLDAPDEELLPSVTSPAVVRLLLSEDGSRLATRYNDTIEVHDTDAGRLVHTQKREEAWGESNRSERRLLFDQGGALLNFASEDCADRRQCDRLVRYSDGAITTSASLSHDTVWISRDGRRVIARGFDGIRTRFTILDGVELTAISELPVSSEDLPAPLGPDDRRARALLRFISGGRIAMIEPGTARILLFSADGTPLAAHAVDGLKVESLGGEIRKDALVVSGAGDSAIVDLVGGQVLARFEGMFPVVYISEAAASADAIARAGAPATALFYRKRQLVRVDPESFAIAVVLGK